MWNSFAKLSGLAAVFSNSKLFNGYALGHLDENKNHSIQVLCGAFMYVRKSAIDKVGMFDEQFFMYGEDIDWSRRIVEGGFEIHYVADTAIIHYKGESTKKASLSYVKTFYNAMGLYVEKHYTGSRGQWFARLLKLAIFVRAGISGMKRLILQLVGPILDGTLIWAGLKGFSTLWANHYFNDPSYYSDSSMDWNIILYSAFWAFILWFIGYYQKISWRKRLVGVFTGLICILIFYALLPDSYRSSRIIILAGALISWIVSSLTSFVLKRNGGMEKVKNILIVADYEVANDIKKSLQKANVKSNVLGIVNPEVGAKKDLNYLNDISQLNPLSKILKADEIIFSSENMEMKDIMKQMMSLHTKLSFKIAGDDSLSILGSNSKNTSGELYNVNIKYNLAEGYYKHVKRVFDFTTSLILILCSPILLFFNKFRLFGLLKNLIQGLLGIKTVVGYSGSLRDFQNLPELNPGIITLPIEDGEETPLRNMYYARDYGVWTDLEVLVKLLNKLT